MIGFAGLSTPRALWLNRTDHNVQLRGENPAFRCSFRGDLPRTSAAFAILTRSLCLAGTATRTTEFADLLHPPAGAKRSFDESGHKEIRVKERPMQPKPIRADSYLCQL